MRLWKTDSKKSWVIKSIGSGQRACAAIHIFACVCRLCGLDLPDTKPSGLSVMVLFTRDFRIHSVCAV